MSNHWSAFLALTLICSLPFEFTKETQAIGAMQGTAIVSGLVTIKGKPANGFGLGAGAYRSIVQLMRE